jgi:hypothetical protein
MTHIEFFSYSLSIIFHLHASITITLILLLISNNDFRNYKQELMAGVGGSKRRSGSNDHCERKHKGWRSHSERRNDGDHGLAWR